MYDSIEDPYCYPETSVLKNVPGLTDAHKLETFEAMATAQRAEEPLPEGGMGIAHYRAIHTRFFQDVYPWAGEFRTVRMGKDGSGFCYPEHIVVQLEELFRELNAEDFLKGLSPEQFAERAARFLSLLNAIHQFREGNGRTQNVFLHLLAEQAGHAFNYDNLEAKDFLEAMIRSFRGDDSALKENILKLIS